jgi:hypothetical protein
MERPMSDYRLDDEVRIPAPALQALAAAAARGGEAVAAAVRDSGRAAGEAITRRVAGVIALSDLDANDFWSAVNAETGARGLGTFLWRRGVGGHAEIIAHQPADSEDGYISRSDPGFPFTEGFIEGLLGAAAEEPVGVLHAPHDGGEGVRFIIGSPLALRHVRVRLERGNSLDEALEGV